MIESIRIAGEATFDTSPEVMGGLSQFNYVFGANGTGKTTLSRVIANCDERQNCSISWKNGTRLDTVVYNRDFVSTNFHQCDELPGIFTLGEKDADAIHKISNSKDELDKLTAKLDELTNTLQGADGNGGKKAELAFLDDSVKDFCWAQKQKHDATLKGAFEGYRNSQDKFKEKILVESTSNTAKLCELTELETRAATVFADSPILATRITPLDCAALIGFESNSMLAKRVVGKLDIDIAALIVKLGNSDWVKTGRGFLSRENGICPFCQQKTPESLEHRLNEYFDETFQADSIAINELESNYRAEGGRIREKLNELLVASHRFVDVERLQECSKLFEASVTVNLQRLATKKKEPSKSVTLDSLGEVLDGVNAVINEANAKVDAHNKTVENLESEKSNLTAEVWRYLLDVELKGNLETFNARKTAINAGIQALEQKIRSQAALITGKKAEIAELERETTSIQPTIDGINRLLKSFGFHGFELTKAENQRCYKLIRPNGSDAKETLSEGERTFVTFLYFYYLLKGSTSESGTTTNRVVVFDDPVSSLDSDILFIVGSLIKGLLEEVRTGKGSIKQVFVLTHNVYFHKEVTFNPNRQQEAMSEETFWTIRKADQKSSLQQHLTNPIKTSYELLWVEVRSQSRSNLTIQNTLRRILENYFRILGGVNPDAICEKFDGKDRMICRSLFSWVNDGSHSAHDDLYVSIEDSAVDGYLRVFREVFKRTDQLPHYRMMMGEAWTEQAESDSESANRYVEVG